MRMKGAKPRDSRPCVSCDHIGELLCVRTTAAPTCPVPPMINTRNAGMLQAYKMNLPNKCAPRTHMSSVVCLEFRLGLAVRANRVHALAHVFPLWRVPWGGLESFAIVVQDLAQPFEECCGVYRACGLVEEESLPENFPPSARFGLDGGCRTGRWYRAHPVLL